MQTVEMYGTFEDAVRESPANIQQLARALRDRIAQICPAVIEVAWPKLHVIGYGIGPKKATEHFCYIGLYASHVNLGFNHGAQLSDPNDLLEGTGKKFRHVRILNGDDISRPGLRELLIDAQNERTLAQA